MLKKLNKIQNQNTVWLNDSVHISQFQNISDSKNLVLFVSLTKTPEQLDRFGKFWP